jgi:transcriptional regulator with XRE-family HTH domain
MTVNVDRQWFVERWTEKGLTLRKVAKLIGVDASALSRTLKGEREMKIPEVGKLAAVLEVSHAAVLAHIEGGDQPTILAAGAEVARITDHPGYGFMRGLIKLEEGFDGTGPYDDEPWDRGYLGRDEQ